MVESGMTGPGKMVRCSEGDVAAANLLHLGHLPNRG